MTRSRTLDQMEWDRRITAVAEEIVATCREHRGKDRVVEVERIIREKLPTIADGIYQDLEIERLRERIAKFSGHIYPYGTK